MFKLEKPYPKEITSVKYCIDVGMETFKKILDRDDEGEDFLYEWLEGVDGVLYVDYDGHFGHYVFVEVEYPKNRDLNFWYEIQKLINMFIME